MYNKCIKSLPALRFNIFCFISICFYQLIQYFEDFILHTNKCSRAFPLYFFSFGIFYIFFYIFLLWSCLCILFTPRSGRVLQSNKSSHAFLSMYIFSLSGGSFLSLLSNGEGFLTAVLSAAPWPPWPPWPSRAALVLSSCLVLLSLGAAFSSFPFFLFLRWLITYSYFCFSSSP